MMYQFQSGDYIRFKRTVQPEQKAGFKTDYSTGLAIAKPTAPEQVLPQGGDGLIIKLAKTKRKVRNLVTNEMECFTVARVAAGAHLGVVTAILDDAELAAKQLTMDLVIESVEPEVTRASMYGTDSKGHA